MRPPAYFEDDVVSTLPSYVPVSEFFSGRGVLITGGTGFLGKVLVEKLLRSCPGVKVIYLLVRPKRGDDIAARLQHVLDSPLFDRLRNENQDQLGKIVAVKGDISEPNLGLSSSDLNMIVEAVSVVFHCAATVKFNEPLKVAVKLNVLGTKYVLDICKKMKSLKALVHVSTCYSNCNLEEVKEVVYPPPYDPDSFARSMEWMDDKLLERLTPTFLGERPNTYTLTKALAENLVSEAAKVLPATIVRPAAVSASWREPVPGWVQGYGAVTSVMTTYTQGLCRSLLYCCDTGVLDLVPVDVVMNLVICAAWRTGLSWSQDITVFNSCTGQTNPLTYRRWFEATKKGAQEYPPLNAYCVPANNILEKNPYVDRYNKWLLQMMPAYIADFIAVLTLQTPSLVQTQKRFLKVCDEISYFLTRSFVFKDDNTRTLLKHLSPEDREEFNFDVSLIDWERYIADCILGIRTYLLNEQLDTLPQARAKIHGQWQWNMFMTCVVASAARVLLHNKL